MKVVKWLLFCLVLFVASSSSSQTVKQFNGLFNITFIKSVSGQYQISGTFSDLSGTFSASSAAVGDNIIDPSGTAFKIVTITSVSGSTINTVAEGFDGTYPSMGQGIIFRPSPNGYPLIANSTPAAVLSTAVNTSTISINSDIPKFQAGATLPSSAFKTGDVVKYSTNNNFYQLTSSGWQQYSASPSTNFSASIASVPIAAKGSMVFLLLISKYYLSDGTAWNEIQTVTNLPSLPKFGDVYYVTGEKKLYMLADGGVDAGGSKWVPISSSGIAGGGTGDFPTDPKPGDLFFNTDNNTLYLFDATYAWVEVSTNGSTPTGYSNPDPMAVYVKEGQLFYNSADTQLFVYNGSEWVPVGNKLGDGQIFVGNSSNVAVAVPMSGDASINNSGKLTINDKAVTDSKLDKANIPLSGFGNPVADVSVGDGSNNYKITNLKTPSAATDAVNKAYVDGLFNSGSLTLAYNNFYVGNALNKAVATPKTSIPLSGFGNPAANISMNGFRLTNLPNPPSAGSDAVTKDYVDNAVSNKTVFPININLSRNMVLVGNDQDQAGMVEKFDIPVSDFGAAKKDVSLGAFKITNLAAPALGTDAVNKDYVDNKIFPSTNIALGNGNFLIGNSSGKAVETIKSLIPLSGFGAATADVSLGSYKITNLAPPAGDNDAVNKKYIEDLLKSPSNTLALPSGNLFVGNATGKAEATLKNAIPVSGFGKATAPVYMGDAISQFTISNLANPLDAQDAATKAYVDLKIANPSSITLANSHILVGNVANQAEAIAKTSVPITDFGAAAQNLSLGNFNITDLRDPVNDGDAVNKKYLTTQLSAVSGLLALPSGQLFVGNASNKATATTKSSLFLNEFGAPKADISFGAHKITDLADPSLAQDAATKNYVDGKTGTTPTTQPASPSAGSTYYNTTEKKLYVYDGTKWIPVNSQLPTGQLYVGDASGNAAPAAKNTISVSDFGNVTKDLPLANFKITGLGTPSADLDAANKKYVDDLLAGVNNLLLLPKGNMLVGDATGKAASVAKSAIPLSGFGDAEANISLGTGSNNYKVINLADPTADHDAANKKYVDSKAGTITVTPPATPTLGSTYYNTTENKLYVYNGTKWIPVNSQLPTGQVYVGDASGNAAAVEKSTISLSEFGAVTKDFPLGNFKITTLADPSSDQDAATKKYVDSKVGSVVTTPPATPTTGSTYYNTTEKKLYVYDGSKWIPVNSQLPTGQLYVGDASGNAAPAEKSTISISEFGAVNKDLPLANFKITGLGTPSADLDAANKKYVDDLFAGINTLLALPKGNMLVGDAAGRAASVAKSAIPLSGFGDAEANISMGTGSNNYKIINLAEPTADLDAVNKKYVDGKIGSISVTPPTTPTPGNTYYNTTEKKLYVYDGTKWIPVNSQLPTGQVYVGDASGNAAAVEKSVISLSEFGSVNKDLPLSDFRITALADPTAAQDAATKKYVDAQVLNVKAAPVSGNTLLGNNTASDAAPQALTAVQVKALLALNNVNNTTDATKNVYSATKLTTPITINGISFDGSSNITVPGDNLGNHTASQNIKTLSYSISGDGQDGRGLSFESSGSGVFAQDVTIKGNLYTPSDERLKTNIVTLSNVLQAIEQMRGVTFEYRDQKKYAKGPKIGVVAQELKNVYPDMVTKGEDGYLKVDYTQLTAVLIEAVKEQQKRMKDQQLEINELKSRLDKQQQQINSILKKLE